MKNKYLKNVVTLKLIQDKCIGCGMCLNVCPHNVFELKDGKAKVSDKDSCMECGACAKNCPVSAIEVKSGAGCAMSIIIGKLTGSEPTCGCAEENDSCC